jgi:hypothetical protein
MLLTLLSPGSLLGDKFALFFIVTGGVKRASSAMFICVHGTPFACRVELVECTTFHDDILIIET